MGPTVVLSTIKKVAKGLTVVFGPPKLCPLDIPVLTVVAITAGLLPALRASQFLLLEFHDLTVVAIYRWSFGPP